MDDFEAITALENLAKKVKIELPYANYKKIDEAIQHLKDNLNWDEYDETEKGVINMEEEDLT